MEPMKVIIANLPNPKPWYIEWAPIMVAAFALIVSIFALYWSREQYTRSSRPYVWFTEYGVVNEKQQMIILPQTVIMKVTNAPAKILSVQYHYYFISGNQKRDIYRYDEKDIVRFPDEKSQTTHTVGNFDQHLKSRQPGEEMERYLRINYTALSGNIKYNYESRSKYDSTENLFRVISEQAS